MLTCPFFFILTRKIHYYKKKPQIDSEAFLLYVLKFFQKLVGGFHIAAACSYLDMRLAATVEIAARGYAKLHFLSYAHEIFPLLLRIDGVNALHAR